ncbi:hypothetical protein ABE096_21080 [Robertmurraya massiliosenegalensis]|uniref:hypothetical protein n=1 Tax=Robertmurraya TaxID=2837507 RepID=UPI0039A6C049
MNNFKNYLEKNYKKVIGWGTSGYFHETSGKLNINMEYLIDSDVSKVGSLLKGIKIESPEILLKENPENILIVIFSSFYKEICENIERFGDFYTVSGEELLRISIFLDKDNKKILGGEDSEKEIILTISRNNYTKITNGLSNFLTQQVEVFRKKNNQCIHIFWRDYNIKGYSGIFISVVIEGEEIGLYSIKDFIRELKKVKAIVIHSIASMDLKTIEYLIEKIDTQNILYYIHDFSCICSNIKLMYNNEYFCESYEKEWSKCFTCESFQYKTKIFEFHETLFLNKKIQLIAPSESTKEIIQKSFNLTDDRIKVISHQKFSKVYKSSQFVNKPIRIAYVGYKHKHKGWEVFKQLVEDYKGRYEFYCFGASDEILDEVNYIDVSFIKDGERAMTNKLREYNIDISLLWSVWPETYSYTYYESFAAGTFVVTNILSGNIIDQVIKNGNGIALENYNQLKKFLDDEIELKEIILKNDIYITDLRRNEDEILKMIQ